MKIKSFFHPQTFTLSYIVSDESTKKAVLIDSVADYDSKASIIGFKSAKIMDDYLKENELDLVYLLETHAHADHLTGANFFKEKYPNSKVLISEKIKDVQSVFSDVFSKDSNNDGREFDQLLTDGETISVGNLSIKAIATPGHTPACMTFVINEQAAFTGDLLFAPDYGTGRCDFPAGSSKDMFNSISNKLYKLDDNIDVYPGHDYMPGGRIVWEKAKLKEHKDGNVQITKNTTESEFVGFRDGRDSGLAAPNLLLQSVQFNAWAGELLEKDKEFIKIPLRKK